MTQKLLVIGAGKMGASILRGLADRQQWQLFATDTHAQKLSKLEEISNVTTKDIEAAAKETYEIVILAVKPQDLENVGSVFHKSLKKDSLLISILAGTTIEDLRKHMKAGPSVIRAMPNIAALVHEAATVVCCDQEITADHRQTVENIFNCLGTCHWSKESLMDAVTGLSGSGPAYIYMVIEALADGGVKMGIPRRMALDLAVQTLLGAGKLVKESGLHPAILKEEVTTPGGTTIHAIQDLEERGLRAMLMSAVEKATNRSKALRD